MEASPVRVQGHLSSYYQCCYQGQPYEAKYENASQVLLVPRHQYDQQVEGHDGHTQDRRHEGFDPPLLRKLLDHRQVSMEPEQSVYGHKQGCRVPDGVVHVRGLGLKLFPRLVQPVKNVEAGRDDRQDDDSDDAEVQGVAFRYKRYARKRLQRSRRCRHKALTPAAGAEVGVYRIHLAAVGAGLLIHG